MQSDSREGGEAPPLNIRLMGIGISESYASQLVNRRRTPSLPLALRIERELGIPVNHWAADALDEATAEAVQP